MKTLLLVLLGVCCGAFGAWLVLDPNASGSGESNGEQSIAFADANGAPGDGAVRRSAGAEIDSVSSGNALAALKLRAAAAPRDAFVEALAFERSGRQTGALIYVARIWARRAPLDALARAAELPDDIRARIESAVAEEWAFKDPEGFLSYAETGGSIDPIIEGLRVMLATDPDRIVGIAERWRSSGNSAADELYLSAMRAMAGRDRASTIARMQSVATGLQRDPILASIAEGYAAKDLDAALAWVYSIQPVSVEAVNTVVRIMAAEDPLRAYDIVWQTRDRPGISRIEQTLAAAALESRLDPALIATALVQRFEPEFSGPFVAALLNNWVLQAPDRAMEWLADNRAMVTPEAVSTMVSTLAFEDVHLAASLLDRVPPEFEYQWLRQTAQRYGQFDPDAAVEWVAQFEPRSDYEQLLGEMVLFGDFRFVSTLIESTEQAFDTSSIYWASTMFARQDPRATAEWALRLTDADEAAAAVRGVTNGWLRTDPTGAQQWALETPRGESRDEIIDTLFDQGSQYSLDYESLIEGYSSDAVANRSISQHVEGIVANRSRQGDAAIRRAEQMIELMTDTELRRVAEERIAEVR